MNDLVSRQGLCCNQYKNEGRQEVDQAMLVPKIYTVQCLLTQNLYDKPRFPPLFGLGCKGIDDLKKKEAPR